MPPKVQPGDDPERLDSVPDGATLPEPHPAGVGRVGQEGPSEHDDEAGE